MWREVSGVFLCLQLLPVSRDFRFFLSPAEWEKTFSRKHLRRKPTNELEQVSRLRSCLTWPIAGCGFFWVFDRSATCIWRPAGFRCHPGSTIIDAKMLGNGMGSSAGGRLFACLSSNTYGEGERFCRAPDPPRDFKPAGWTMPLYCGSVVGGRD